MNVIAIIAARMASTRFPNKPLARIKGIPMIGHVYSRAKLAHGIHQVWIATCDTEIMAYAESIGAQAVMTKGSHERATERIAEALPIIELLTGETFDVAVLVQGDEPMLMPQMLEALAEEMEKGTTAIANLMSEIIDDDEFKDANTVKVVCDLRKNALMFSREPIPSTKKFTGRIPKFKQLGLIAFTREALLAYATLKPTPLETIESVDMNRLLENGYSIRMVSTPYITAAVDTPEQLVHVEALMTSDKLLGQYARSIR